MIIFLIVLLAVSVGYNVFLYINNAFLSINNAFLKQEVSETELDIDELLSMVSFSNMKINLLESVLVEYNKDFLKTESDKPKVKTNTKDKTAPKSTPKTTLKKK
jgi:hypothetical protein